MQRIPTHISGDGTAVPLVPPPPRNIRRRAGKCPLSGVKRTCLFALHMSAFDPKRTLGLTSVSILSRFILVFRSQSARL